jgi:hypothetical protein
VVFVLAEFQLIDAHTAALNEEGEASHVAYKTRQHSRVRERMLRAPSGKNEPSGGQPTANGKDVVEDRREDDPLGRYVQSDVVE